MVPVPPTRRNDGEAAILDEETGAVTEQAMNNNNSNNIVNNNNNAAEERDIGETEIGTRAESSSSSPPIIAREVEDDDAVEEAMAVNASIELDEEGGQLKEDNRDDDDDDDDNDDDDDDISVPPPPPPPLPPTMQGGTTVSTPGNDDSKTRKTTKIALLTTVGILVCAGIGLGLGFGLTSGGSSKNNAYYYSSQADTGISSDESETVTSTTSTATATFSSTDATAWSSTDATMMADTDMNDTTTSAPTTTSTAEEIEMYDAIIVGAGWAGIRATETLLNEGITSILVLEANDYVGGRARSFNGMDGSTNNPETIGTVNVPYDLGADWIYDNGNEMVAALSEGGYLDAVLSSSSSSFSGIDDDATLTSSVLLSTAQFYKLTTSGGNNGGANGGSTMTTEVIEASDQWIQEVWNGFITFRENNLDDLDGLSYQEAIDQYIDQSGLTDDEYLQFLNVIEDTMEYEYTADSSQLDISEIEYYPPGFSIDTQYLGVPGLGFGNLAAQYAELTSVQEKVLLNAKVIEINSSISSSSSQEESEFTTVTYVRNGVSKVVQAKTVLVTVSLGVLKAGTIDFIPSLPDSKLESINNMGFGTVNKCMMSWNNDDDLVWPEDEYWFLLLTPKDDEDGGGQTQQRQQQYSPWTTFFNPTKFKGKPSLTAWLGGKEAIYAEDNQTDDEILEDVMMNLRAMFPTIRDPDRVIITRWGQDPNTLGAYSYPVPGRDLNSDAATLQEVYGNIYFAGEATGSGWATTQGAWRTGEAAALSIAENLQGR